MPLEKAEMEALAKKLASEGKLVMAGWVAYRLIVIPPEAGQIQIEECRRAFMAGARHMFFSLMYSVGEPTEANLEADLKKMKMIHLELELFEEQMKAQYAAKTKWN